MIPNNAGYYHAAYLIVVLVHTAYAASIWLRRRAVRARLGAASGARPRG
jgi:hypothetical protein